MGGVGWEAHRIIVSKEDIYRDREPKTLEYKTSRSPASIIPYTLKPKTLEYRTGRNPYFWSIRMPELAWKKCKQTTFYHSLYSNFLRLRPRIGGVHKYGLVWVPRMGGGTIINWLVRRELHGHINCRLT